VNKPATIKQSDLKRYVKAYQDAGNAPPKVEIRPDGSVLLIPVGDATNDPNPCDRLLK
jgi:hypothetical protein